MAQASKKLYVAVAARLRSQLERAAKYGDTTAPSVLRHVADELADIFKADNVAFQRSVFLTACGFTEDV